MEKRENKESNEVISKVLRAGKRTYFFDLKETKNQEHYLTITESKYRFDEIKETHFYEKNKIFLHIQDVENFGNTLNEIISYIHSHENEIQSIRSNRKNELENREDN